MMEKLARRYHQGQFRKGEDNIPYIVHPEKVVSTLIEWGEQSSIVIDAAWGHDLLEDTKVAEDEILAASCKEVLACIKELTCPKNGNKRQYLQNIANKSSRNALVIKIADRINNSKDFLDLEGPLYAYQYLHAADCLVPSLEKISSSDVVAKNALQEWEALDNQLATSAKLDAIRGSLIGGAVGDALGAPIEFLSYSNIISRYNDIVKDYVEFGDSTGSITDDTQMVLFTAEGILRANTRNKLKGICDSTSILNLSYQRWLVTQGYPSNVDNDIINSGWLINQKELYNVRAPGNTCLSSLMTGKKKAFNNSKGCGSVMRMAPVGLFFSPKAAFIKGCEYSNITHGHPTGVIAGGALAMLIAYLVNGKTLEDSLDLLEEHLLTVENSSETLLAIKKARTVDDITLLGEGWVAEEALAIGIFCALHYTWDFAAGVINAINITGDSDSTGSIAGNILGVLNGEKAIPLKWRQNLREYGIVSQVANDLHKTFEEEAKLTNYPQHQVSSNWWNKYPGF